MVRLPLPLLLLALLTLQLLCEVLLLVFLLTCPVLLGREAEQAEATTHSQCMCEHTGQKQQLQLVVCAVLCKLNRLY
jgi:hypothetical protein